MRGWQKFGLWAFILLMCAGVGAFVASRSNPFPPEVGTQGPPQDESPSPQAEGAVRWTLTMTSRTTHTYRVGGSCSSDWRMRARIRVSPNGRVEGRGVARLLPGARCDFPSAQVQAKAVSIRISGERAGRALELRLRAVDVDPPGAQDLGGFVRTLTATRFSIGERGGARDRKSTRVEDPEDEFHAARTTLRLSR